MPGVDLRPYYGTGVFLRARAGEDQVSEEGIVLGGGASSVRLARGDELFDAREPVAGGPSLGRAEVRPPRADQPAGGPFRERSGLAVAHGPGDLAHLPRPRVLGLRAVPGGQHARRAGALDGVGGEFVGDREPLGAGQLAQCGQRV